MSIGLDDVVAAETALSHVDGEAGRLIICGHDLEELAGHVSFEDVVAMLWTGLVPNVADPRALLGRARVRAYRHLARLADRLTGLTPVEGMRLLLSSLPDAEEDHPVLAVGAAGVAAAMAVRGAQGLAPVEPDARAGHAADILRMMRDAPVASDEAQGLDTYLVTVIDHGLNASTFTARVVASTQAGILSSVVAGLCALKGPLHGGAPGPVLDMLDAIGSIENAEAWLDDAMARGERLMGFGHRIYRVRDPRADVLMAAVGRLKGRSDRIAFAEAVEVTALKVLERRKPGRRLDTNVEFYTAILLDALGVPREGFTPLFAAGRTAGWVAHDIEQEKVGRIIRPQSRYVGAWPAEAA
ncbi:citrate synthase/methylcitrate synthase [Microvirga mediterraneensis]|uniref:citrate synthase (unknown stereospecificity) n=1 Tax=Microvirga mediterraneensis TaxID=2754695 RepID=A0A838BUU1_9HYPH|nr:citrate synthase/methylcitrate synthase [Microvirga mediterraneensis]MBA1158246.1 citrate synthase/methylcitrate synthase [Microvirga mediterraneensis]